MALVLHSVGEASVGEAMGSAEKSPPAGWRLSGRFVVVSPNPSLPLPTSCSPAAHQQQVERPPPDENASGNAANSGEGALRGSGGEEGRSQAAEDGGGGEAVVVEEGGVKGEGEVDGGLRAIEGGERSSAKGGSTMGGAVEDGAAETGGRGEKEQPEVCVSYTTFCACPPKR